MAETSLVPVADKIVTRGEVRLQTQAFGSPAEPPVLLIMGVMSSMLWWPEDFCRQLAGSCRHVIRYDHRDTGLSTQYPPGQPGYTFADLTTDALAILDGYGLASAHVVGMSMGGFIAQDIALRYPSHLRSLTLISTSPVGVEGLPPPTEAYQRHSAASEAIDWSDLGAVAAFMERDVAMLAGTRHPHDAAAARALIARDMARSPSFASAANHFILPGGDIGAALHASQIAAPVLAIHGTSDPLFPLGHGEAFTRLLPMARSLWIEGGGHEIHELDIPEVVQAVLEHTAA